VKIVVKSAKPKIAVVIPCYRVRDHIADVVAAMPSIVGTIFVIDDCCPEQSYQRVEGRPRVVIVRHDVNKGVGGAMITGYRAALDAGYDIVVKVDGDGQMDPALIPIIAGPVIDGRADYAKGNRFHSIYNVRTMPGMRLFGNAVLSFLTKISSGYWAMFDPTNGYTAIHAEALRGIEFNNLDERYFFESDMLINLGNIRAVVADVPMAARYGDEVSNLKIGSVFGPFLWKNIRETAKRVLYGYFLRDFSLASAQLVFGVLLCLFGGVFGVLGWTESSMSGQAATTGTVMVAVLPIILGFQLLLGFIGFDMTNEPRIPLQTLVRRAEI
jgi:dolichol-phosphate mannosyltransferase